MDIVWTDLLAAIALLLIIEGMLPFLTPGSMRQMLQTVSQLDDRTLRIMGLVSMIIGVVLLTIVR